MEYSPHIFQCGAFASYNVDSDLCIQVSIELEIMISQKHLNYMWVRPNSWTRQQMHLAPHRVIRSPDARRMNVSNKNMLWVAGENNIHETKAQSVYNGLHQIVACNPNFAFPKLHVIQIVSLWMGELPVIIMVHGWVGGRCHACEERRQELYCSWT